MNTVAQNFKILSNRTVRVSALVTFPDTKQGFSVMRGEQSCMEDGLCNTCKFLYVFIVFVFTTNLIVQIDIFFSTAFVLRN